VGPLRTPFSPSSAGNRADLLWLGRGRRIMRPLRTLVSALSIVVGVVLIAAWALANVVANVVEDGTAARAMTERALDSPASMGAVTDDLSDRAGAALSDVGLNVGALGLERQLDQV